MSTITAWSPYNFPLDADGWMDPLDQALGRIDYADWGLYQKFYLALEERAKGLLTPRWPQEIWTQFSLTERGVITSATPTRITTDQPHPDTAGHWYNTVRDAGGYPWNWPISWELVLDIDASPWLCWKLPISVESSTNSIVASLSTWLNEESGAVGVSLPGTLTCAGKIWDGNTFGNYWVTYVVGGISKTVRVVRTVGGTAFLPNTDIPDIGTAFHLGRIAAPGDLVGSKYFIVPLRGLTWSDRWLESPYNAAGGVALGGMPWADNRGLKQGQFHTPNPGGGFQTFSAPGVGFIAPAYTTNGGEFPFTLPPADGHWERGNGFATANDNDCWAPCLLDIQQTNWGKCFTPDLYKTIRGLQLGTLSMGGSYLNGGDATSWNYLPYFLPVDLFPTLIAVGTIVKPLSHVWYTTIYTDPLTGQQARIGGSVDANNVGAWTVPTNSDTVVDKCSLGFTRKFPRQVRNMWARKTLFIPHYQRRTDTVGFVTTAHDYLVDPPIAGMLDPEIPAPNVPEVGRWVTRGIDSHYIDGDAFVEGEIARDLGDTWDDPTWADWAGITYASEVDPIRPEPPLRKYVERGLNRITPTARMPNVSGVILETLPGWIRCSALPGWETPVRRAETGTATDGDTTRLIDTSKATSPFWQSSNVLGATGRWVGFILEVLIAGVWIRRPITSMVGTTLTVSPAFPASTAGCEYQIREPKGLLNAWQDHILLVTKADRSTLTYTITNSDDGNLWFTGVETLLPGWTFRIVVNIPGQCWQWSKPTAAPGKWIKPTGMDARYARAGIPAVGIPGDPGYVAAIPAVAAVAWPDDQTCIHPTTVIGYGLYQNHDYIGPWLFNELQAALHRMTTVMQPAHWTGTPKTIDERPYDIMYNSSPGQIDYLPSLADLDTNLLFYWENRYGTPTDFVAEGFTQGGGEPYSQRYTWNWMQRRNNVETEPSPPILYYGNAVAGCGYAAIYFPGPLLPIASMDCWKQVTPPMTMQRRYDFATDTFSTLTYPVYETFDNSGGDVAFAWSALGMSEVSPGRWLSGKVGNADTIPAAPNAPAVGAACVLFGSDDPNVFTIQDLDLNAIDGAALVGSYIGGAEADGLPIIAGSLGSITTGQQNQGTGSAGARNPSYNPPPYQVAYIWGEAGNRSGKGKRWTLSNAAITYTMAF